MTDFDNKDLTGQTPEAPETQETPQPEQPKEAPAAAPAPHLTLEPNPPQPEIPSVDDPAPSGAPAQPFQMPDPPRAPQPPQPEPAYQQTPPNYTAQSQNGAPQYNAPQYGANPYQTPPYSQPVQQTYYNVPPVGYVQKSRLAAGLLAILFGALGIHNYYLGFNSRATIQLVVSLAGGLLTCGVASVAMAVWGFIEGVLILSANTPSRMYDGNGVILKD